jgi:sugar O-acyltransferase (sialic acid O-acetyltransferase NeuD family)
MILGIYGAGGLGNELHELARDINRSGMKWTGIVFVDDADKPDLAQNIKIISFVQAKNIYSQKDIEFVIAVGEPAVRTAIRSKVESADYRLATLIHPSSKTCDDLIIGDGSIIGYGCFISCNVHIGKNVLIQPNASIGHDSVIGEDSIISTCVTIAGATQVGRQTYIGMNVPVKEFCVIGSESIVGMGSVVLRDIPDSVIAMGNPARAMKKNENHRVFG